MASLKALKKAGKTPKLAAPVFVDQVFDEQGMIDAGYKKVTNRVSVQKRRMGLEVFKAKTEEGNATFFYWPKKAVKVTKLDDGKRLREETLTGDRPPLLFA